MTNYDPTRKRRRRRRRLLALVVILLVVWGARSWLSGSAVEKGSYILLDVSGSYPEEPPQGVFGMLLRDRARTLLEVVDLIRDAARDERVAGMVVRIRSLETGWGKTQDIRDALREFRDAEKDLVGYLEQEFTASTLEYYLASVANRIYLPAAASAPVSGLLAQYVFLGGVWEKLDVEMDVERIGAYKTAGDMIAGRGMTPEHREMADWLLDDIFGQFVSGVAEARGLDPAAVRAAVDNAPVTAEELVDAGLADGIAELEEIRAELLDPDKEFIAAADYSDGGGLLSEPLIRRKIAVVFGVGPISTGESRSGAVDGATMGSETISEALRDAAEDEDAEAIVFRIDSPGGSALASDLIWSATQRARESKPLFVSMSDVAGSGGYYVAAGATRVFAQPGTLTGSIGVVVTKPNVSGLLANLGVGTETLARGERAGMSSLVMGLTPEQRERVVTAMQHVYDVFVDRVAAGRSLTRDQVDAVGRGRVWTGAQAREKGLVDELGGFIAAIQAAKAAVGIPESEQVELVFYPKPKAFFERLGDFVGARVAAELPPWLARLRAAVSAYDFPDGSVLTLMPQWIEIR